MPEDFAALVRYHRVLQSFVSDKCWSAISCCSQREATSALICRTNLDRALIGLPPVFPPPTENICSFAEFRVQIKPDGGRS